MVFYDYVCIYICIIYIYMYMYIYNIYIPHCGTSGVRLLHEEDLIFLREHRLRGHKGQKPSCIYTYSLHRLCRGHVPKRFIRVKTHPQAVSHARMQWHGPTQAHSVGMPQGHCNQKKMKGVWLSQHQSPPPLLRKARARSQLYGYARVTRPRILGIPLSVFNKNSTLKPPQCQTRPQEISHTVAPALWNGVTCHMMESHVMWLFAKEPVNLGLSCGKWPIKIRDPMSLRHPVLEFTKWNHMSCHRAFRVTSQEIWGGYY